MASCQTTGTGALNELTFCDGVQPIYWSKKDTTLTVKQIKELNAVYKATCVPRGK